MTEPRRLHWTPELVARFWDFESTRPENYFTFQFGHDLVRELAPQLEGRRSVLDFGCGAGFLIEHLLAPGREVHGLDFSPASVDEVNRRLGGRPGFAGAALPDDLRPPADGFDVVLCCEVVEHLYDDDLDATLGRLRDLVRPRGVVVVTTPNDEDLGASEVYCPVSNVVFHRWQHVRSWTGETLAAVLRSHGLEPIEVRPMHVGRTRRTSPVTWAVDALRARLGRGAKPPHLLVVARR